MKRVFKQYLNESNTSKTGQLHSRNGKMNNSAGRILSCCSCVTVEAVEK